MSFLLNPSIFLGLLFSIGYASLYHLWGGRTVSDLFIYLIMAILGFTVGQILGEFTQVSFLQIGQLHMVEATLLSWIALIGFGLLENVNTA